MSQPAESVIQFLDPRKFQDPRTTADGDPRAHVRLRELETLWICTGTLCNLECRNCYIESSPSNDRLVYISTDEVAAYLDEIERDRLGTRTIAFTGGEPFMNPDMIPILDDVLTRGFEALVLTNAMRPMMKVADPLLDIQRRHGDRLTVRVSIDHYDRDTHEEERGPRSWAPAIKGLHWLTSNGFTVDIAGRLFSGESEHAMRLGYADLFRREHIGLDAHDARTLVLFPEMDARLDVPEITEACWDIVGTSPDAQMCASSRMVIKRKGAAHPVVVPCTLLPYDPQFELGRTLAESFVDVPLNHPHCAKFCVLGGASCSG
ncbi:radical SAM protein [Aquisalimonas asiatica]|uniref:4Fe-4S single cluster domain-containing protein n=1 Tax=Aquisalimonas asiatica TaxID=406100 RepID=A0A1H8TG63_9GAMM|nr:radical SAM protein [Aquisalimonas asiatica]SEO89736.1 4Fe-4S single cluster domain-containing protein [Aquisalimonas asiatica]